MTVEEPPRDATERFESLDALRGVLAIMVVLFHFPSAGHISALPLVRHSDLFVDYFFVLSGFVIAFSYGDRLTEGRISVGKFMGLRMGRIYPLHLAVLAAYASLDLVKLLSPGHFSSVVTGPPFSGSRNLPDLASNLLLLQSSGVGSALSWNPPSWSIAAEVWTYALFAALLAVERKISVSRILLLSAAALVGLAILDGSIITASVVRSVYGFGIGFVTYQLFRRRPFHGGHAAELLVVAAAVLFVSVATGAWTLAAPLVFACGVYVFAGSGGIVARLLKTRLFQLLGLVSYSIYMVHYFLQTRLLQALHLMLPSAAVWRDGRIVLAAPPLLSDAVTLAMVIAVVGVSCLTYWLIERPGRELTRNWLRQRADRKLRAQAAG